MEQLFKDLTGVIPPWAYVAITGSLIAFWQKIKAMASGLLVKVWAEDILDSDLFAGFTTYLQAQGAKPSELQARIFGVDSFWVQTSAVKQMVAYRHLRGSATTFWRWHGPIPLPLHVDAKDGSMVSVRYLRGTLNMPQVVCQIVAEQNRKKAFKRKRFQVTYFSGRGSEKEADNKAVTVTLDSDETWGRRFIPLGISADVLGLPPGQGGSTKLWLCPKARGLLDDASQWHRDRDWYTDRGLAWKRGYLLHGLPGTGKSSLVRAIAIDLDMPVFVFNLGAMTDDQLQLNWKHAATRTPCVVLLEDLDAVYHGRKPANPSALHGSPPGFDWLLNLIDGVGVNDGILLCITTNHIDRVDTALGGLMRAEGDLLSAPQLRPGRVDRCIEVPATMPPEGRQHIAQRILRGYEGSLEATVEAGINDTPAQFQERCVRTALALREGVKPDFEGLEAFRDSPKILQADPPCPEAPEDPDFSYIGQKA